MYSSFPIHIAGLQDKIQVDVPDYPRPEGDLQYWPLPKFLNVARGEYHPFEVDKDRSTTVIRWRRKEGKIESNARFVEWSDGSIQLMIGDEVMNVKKSK